MSAHVEQPGWRGKVSARRVPLARAAVVVGLLAAVVLGTKVVKDGSGLTNGPAAFSSADFGKANFPKVQAAIEKKAAPADVLAAALAKDQASAVAQYGTEVPGAPGPELAVSFTGQVVGAPQDGVYTVAVAGAPKDLVVRVQTGPAINGTDLRDAAGLFSFGQFTDQIDYQNAASALNDQLRSTVLAKAGTAPLTGKTVKVTGAFELINPNGWLVTPVSLDVS
jgi:predicted lipoprotein